MEIFVVLKNDLGTPEVRTFASKSNALKCAEHWYEDTIKDLELFGHQITGKEFIKELGDGSITTEIGSIDFDLMITKLGD